MQVPSTRIYFSKEDQDAALDMIRDSLTSGQVAMGKHIQTFEEEFAAYVGAKHAVSVGNGTVALEAAMHTLQVAGKKVLVPANTFLSTASSVIWAGGEVAFIDADPETFGVDFEDLKRKVDDNTLGVIIVHIGGIISPKIEEIVNWCQAHDLWVFEDCAHAHGSEMGGKRGGMFGVGGAYSFFATKVMTSGEGGMVVTNDDAFADTCRLLRNHGKPQPWVSYHTHLGSNWRMNEFAAAVGLTQLRRLDEFIAWRGHIADIYSEMLRDVPELTPVVSQDRSSWYKYIVLLPKEVDRQALKAAVREKGVRLSGEVYETPLHKQPVFASRDIRDCPVAEDICAHHVCLPLFYSMKDEEATYVVDTLVSTLRELI